MTQKELKFKLENNHNEQEDLKKRLGQLEKEKKDLTTKNYELRAEANQVFKLQSFVCIYNHAF